MASFQPTSARDRPMKSPVLLCIIASAYARSVALWYRHASHVCRNLLFRPQPLKIHIDKYEAIYALKFATLDYVCLAASWSWNEKTRNPVSVLLGVAYTKGS